MPEWKLEIKQRLTKLKLEPTREAEIVEELSVLTAGLLACVALTAMLVPARRATKVDPMVALRDE